VSRERRPAGHGPWSPSRCHYLRRVDTCRGDAVLQIAGTNMTLAAAVEQLATYPSSTPIRLTSRVACRARSRLTRSAAPATALADQSRPVHLVPGPQHELRPSLCRPNAISRIRMYESSCSLWTLMPFPIEHVAPLTLCAAELPEGSCSARWTRQVSLGGGASDRKRPPPDLAGLAERGIQSDRRAGSPAAAVRRVSECPRPPAVPAGTSARPGRTAAIRTMSARARPSARRAPTAYRRIEPAL
jgi:hypothetical protein